MATTMPSTITFQATPTDNQTTIPPHLEQPGPSMIQYSQTPAPRVPAPPATQSTPTKTIFELGRDRAFSTTTWTGSGLLKAVWKNPLTLSAETPASTQPKSLQASQMQDCELVIRLAKSDPEHAETPAALRQIFTYFANVLMVGGDYAYALQRLSVRFLWGASDWDGFGFVPVSCQYALEPLLGLQEGLSVLELEGVEPMFAAKFAMGLTGREEVMPQYPEIAPDRPDYAEMEKKGEPYFDWDTVEPLVGSTQLRETLVFSVAGVREP